MLDDVRVHKHIGVECPFCKGTGRYTNHDGDEVPCYAVISEIFCDGGQLARTEYEKRPEKYKITGVRLIMDTRLPPQCEFILDDCDYEVPETCLYATEADAWIAAHEMNASRGR